MSIEESKRKPGNPLWVPGTSGNPEGLRRRKHSALTVEGQIESVILGYTSSRKYKKDLYAVTPERRLEHVEKMRSKIPANAISEDQVDKIFELVQNQLRNVEQKKVS